MGRLPPPEPGIFAGDPLHYPGWKGAFCTLIERRGIPSSEKLHYLKRYLGGAAKEAVEGYLLLSSPDAYEEAKELLEKRYGDPFVIAGAFRDKLESWPKIQSRDGIGLRKYADFLKQCSTAMTTISSLNVLNDDRENHRMLFKLPDWLVTRWSRIVASWKATNHSFPPFNEFVKFVEKESNIACDPITSLQSLKIEPNKTSKITRRHTGANTLSTEVTSTKKEHKPTIRTSTDRAIPNTCVFCEKPRHNINDCRQFLGKPLELRKEFAKKHNLCFGCLGVNHRARQCKDSATCSICNRRHPTPLHGDTPKSANDKDIPKSANDKDKSANYKDEIELETFVQSGTTHLNDSGFAAKSSMILPVWVSHTDTPDKEHLTYALLDNQSDTTFALDGTCEALGVSGTNVNLMLSTMLSENVKIDSRRIRGLVVRGYASDLKIPLPSVYTRSIMPANRSHIPTPDVARKWFHLESVVDKLTPLLDCEIGLLIGYDCSRALAPREVVAPKQNGIYAQRTDLGWGIVGVIDPNYHNDSDPIGVSNHILTLEVPSALCGNQNSKDLVHFSFKTSIKKSTEMTDVKNMFELDFSEHKEEETSYSQDDRKFLSQMEQGIHRRQDGHYETPLPFRKGEPHLPNNRSVVLKRLLSLRSRLSKDISYRHDYSNHMDNIIKKGYAERVPEIELAEQHGRVWYIPHHGVYQPNKPGKLRVVFDCSAQCHGESLNGHLLTGPDLTNKLIGVLTRFRKEPVAIMCDVSAMFHQFGVNKEHRDYFRFLWWQEGDIGKDVAEFRMTVHLFGASSSPGCANFALKQLARDYEVEFGTPAATFIQRNFYVDDGLTSLPSEQEAITLIQDTMKLCDKGGLRLHKFNSNSRRVLASVPVPDRVKEVEDVNLLFDSMQVERALGVQWCVESDTFQFRITLKDRPLTRRGVLSTLCSVYDPLGFISPVVLVGKRMLQRLCVDGSDWDSPLPDDIRAEWEAWRAELPLLAEIRINRCFKPDRFGTVKSIELHSFSDASNIGYGQCSYLRLLDDHDNVHCSLVMAKSRVTPMKPVTIPRLELTAAVVSVQVASTLAGELDYPDVKQIFWCDSQVVLGYIGNDARRFHVFVANRVQKIKDLSESSQWNYVASDQNPADMASRGVRAKDFIENTAWIQGPSFLYRTDVPHMDIKVNVSHDDPDVKKQSFAIKALEFPSIAERLERFSDWNKARRAIALCLRLKLRLLGKNGEEWTSRSRVYNW